MVENFRAGLSKSVCDYFSTGSLGSQLHKDAAIDGINLRFLGGAASKDGGGFTKGENVFDHSVDPGVIVV